MLRRLQVQNYRVLRDVDCTFSRFTCIVGPNGCGKSTLLEAIDTTSAVRTATNQMGTPFPAGAELTADHAGEAGILRMKIKQGKISFGVTWYSVNEQQAVEGLPVPGKVAPCHRPTFFTSNLRASYPVNEQRKTLAPEGQGLSGLLADWKLEDDPRLPRVEEQLARVVPQVKGLSPRRNGGVYELFFLVGPERKKIPAQDMSTGTLYALALLVLLESLGGEPALVLIDDLDRDLHPEAQRELVERLRQVLDERPELQIVVTSHSPYLVDHFLASEVLVMALDDEGYGHIAPLISHPDYPRLGGAMRPGEFWSAVGERWVLHKKEQIQQEAS